MKAELITIGDEILIGQIVDTNSAWISSIFANNGINTSRIVSVSDNETEIRQGIESAIERADVVIVTGGLGPTKDDITKQTIAKMFGVGLVRNERVFHHVREMMQSRGVEFNRSNQSQALVPEGCTVLMNDNGTAPGMMMTRGSKLIFSLPGVPFEMKALIKEQVLDIIRSKFALESMIHRTVLTFGMAESVLSETIEEWENALPGYIHLAYLPNPKGIRLRLSAYEVTEEVLQEIEDQFDSLRKIITPYYLGYEPISVEGALAELLNTRKATLAVAESCTGGLISAKITALEGASKYFVGGITAYANEVKCNLLEVSKKDLATYGAVSQQVVEQMAVGVMTKLGSDYAIATSGIAGSTGGTPDRPVGTVWIAIAWHGGVDSRLMRFGTLRDQNMERAAIHGLNMLRLHILGQDHKLQNSSVL